MLNFSVPPGMASADPAFFVADQAPPTGTAATSIATPTINKNRESKCLLRIVLLPLPLTAPRPTRTTGGVRLRVVRRDAPAAGKFSSDLRVAFAARGGAYVARSRSPDR